MTNPNEVWQLNIDGILERLEINKRRGQANRKHAKEVIRISLEEHEQKAFDEMLAKVFARKSEIPGLTYAYNSVLAPEVLPDKNLTRFRANQRIGKSTTIESQYPGHEGLSRTTSQREGEHYVAELSIPGRDGFRQFLEYWPEAAELDSFEKYPPQRVGTEKLTQPFSRTGYEQASVELFYVSLNDVTSAQHWQDLKETKTRYLIHPHFSNTRVTARRTTRDPKPIRKGQLAIFERTYE